MSKRELLVDSLGFNESDKEHWEALINKNKCKPRVIDFCKNKLDFCNVEKQRKTNNTKLFMSVNPGGLMLKELPYFKNKNIKNEQVIEQFEILLTPKQTKELYEDLGKRLNKCQKK